MALFDDDPYLKGQQFGKVLKRVAPFVLNPVGNTLLQAGQAVSRSPVGKFVSGAISGLPGFPAETAQQTVDTTRAGEFGMNDRGAGFDPLKPIPSGPAALQNMDFSTRGTPGSQRQVNYGYGDVITGTANAAGRFNSFTNVPAPPNPNAVSAPGAAAPVRLDAGLQATNELAYARRAMALGLDPTMPAAASPVSSLGGAAAVPYGTPGVGGGPTTADVIAASELTAARGMGANYRARQAVRARERKMLAEATLLNAQANTAQAQAQQMTALNQYPIAQMNTIPAMVNAQAHMLAARQAPGVEQARIAAQERGQTLSYLPHIPDLTLKNEALKRVQAGDLPGAQNLLTLGSARNIAQPKGFKLEFDALGNQYLLDQDTGKVTRKTPKEMEEEAEKAKKDKLRELVK